MKISKSVDEHLDWRHSIWAAPSCETSFRTHLVPLCSHSTRSKLVTENKQRPMSGVHAEAGDVPATDVGYPPTDEGKVTSFNTQIEEALEPSSSGSPDTGTRSCLYDHNDQQSRGDTCARGHQSPIPSHSPNGDTLGELSARSRHHTRISRETRIRSPPPRQITRPDARTGDQISPPIGTGSMRRPTKTLLIRRNSSRKCEEEGSVGDMDAAGNIRTAATMPTGMTGDLMRRVAALDVTRMTCGQVGQRSGLLGLRYRE